MNRIIYLAALFVAPLTIEGALAQSYPNKPITIVVGYGAGGVTDLVARTLADGLSTELGQAVLVENRPGASALIAVNAVKSAEPDGYTLFMGPTTGFSLPLLKEGMDASQDLAPISLVTAGDFFIYTPAETGVTNFNELKEYSKEHPIKSGSIGATNTLTNTMISEALGIQFQDIRFKTTEQIVISLLQNEIQIVGGSTAGYDGHVQDGKINIIAVLSPERSKLWPDVPTALEQGADVIYRFTNGFWAPKATPQEIIEKLNGAVAKVLARTEVQETYQNMSLSALPSSPEDLIEDYHTAVDALAAAANTIGLEPM